MSPWLSNGIICISMLQLNSSGGAMIRLRAKQHRLQIPVEAREFSLLQNVQTQSHIQWILGFFPHGGKAARA